MSNVKPFAWRDIDTVLVDMDGTLLDLAYDDYFWRELVPARYGARKGMTPREAWAHLKPRFDARRGELEWYCLEHWSEELDLDLANMKTESRDHIRFLPEARRFLTGVRKLGKRIVLVTNAHRDALLVKAKATGLMQYIDEAHSSHDYGVPKENIGFWKALVRRDPAINKNMSVMIDDSVPVLEAADRFGIRYIVEITRPATTGRKRASGRFASVDTVVELLP